MLPPKIKDLEKSRIINVRYIIKRYAKSKRSWNFEIGPKVGYGLYVYDPRYISKMSSKKNRGAPPP